MITENRVFMAQLRFVINAMAGIFRSFGLVIYRHIAMFNHCLKCLVLFILMSFT